MNWFLTIVVGFLTAVFGLLIAAVLGSLNVRWYRISGFEGGAGYYVGLIALIGGVVGFVVGMVGARAVAGWPEASFLKGLGLSVGSMAGLVVAVAVVCWLAADIPPKIAGKNLELVIEVRAPQGFALPPELKDNGAFAGVVLLRDSAQPTGDLRLEESKQIDGRWVVPATVPLNTSASNKHLRVHFRKEHDFIFPIKLRSHPNRKDLEWSDWVECGWKTVESRSESDDIFLLRYKVQIVPPPPPGKTQAEFDAEQAANEQAVFEAIPHDAPIATWLPYTRYGTSPERLAVAIKSISRRETFVAELTELILGPDHKIAADAMNLIEHLTLFPPELNASIATAGQKIAGMILTFNATPPEQDPAMQGAADVSARFSAWMTAAETLRKQSSGDFTAELHAILKLARIRQDSHEMRISVVRVASYYLKEWAGIEPLPTDPKPR